MTEDVEGPKGKTLHYHLKWTWYWLFLICSIPFIITIPEYSRQFRINKHESWLGNFYGVFSSYPEFFDGPGSINYDQFKFYTDYNWAITIHTIPGSIWIICGFIQFNNHIRNNYVKIHRISGYVYFICLILSLIGSGAMLVLHIIKGNGNGDLLIYTNNGATHLFLTFFWAAGVITG